MPANAVPDSERPALVLFRNDLRIADNKALSAAAASGRPVICAFILDESAEIRKAGAASRWWLHHSLESLAAGLRKIGVDLILRQGDMGKIVEAICADSNAAAIYWNRRYATAEAAVDADMKQTLRARGLIAESFDGQLLHEPTRLKTGGGTSYKVFGAFKRALETLGDPRDPVDAPTHLKAWRGKLPSDRLADWALLPSKPDWAGGLRDCWQPGETAAHERLDDFLADQLQGYAEGRDFPGGEVTSRLSPHLAHGEITPFQIMARLSRIRAEAKLADAAKMRSELFWREFCHHLLFQFPDLANKNFDHRFDRFQWAPNAKNLDAWKRGLTGYPIVDAGMRELWQTGYMHNRVRMIVASFLAKHLLIDWREGEQWFWDTLVDADPASNPGNWQWVAGSGADAAPYFRIFNPILQGEKFDPDGVYVRRFVPELDRLSNKYIHKPWVAPAQELHAAKVKLGASYPVPLIDHQQARARALQAYSIIRGPDEYSAVQS